MPETIRLHAPHSWPTSLKRRRDFLRLIAGASGTLAAPMFGNWSRAAGENVLTIAIPSNPSTFDPVNASNHDAMVVSQSVFENLVEVGSDGTTLMPQLAKALPKISTDGMTYTFDLRDDVIFQNGQKFTAEDVKYSFDYLLDPKNKAVRRPLFDPITAVTVESPTRVRFQLSEPYRPWLFYLTKYMGIFPKGSREQGDPNMFRVAPVGIGTGPGIFEEWRQNDFVSLKKNPHYWQKGLPHWDRLVVRIIPEDSVRIASLVTGRVDIISAPPPKDFAQLKNKPGLKGDSTPSLGTWLVLLANTKKAPFDDVNARRAIAQALDREAIAKHVFYGLVDPVSIPAPSRGWWFSKSANEVNSFNLAKAKANLAKSKYPNGFEFEMMMPSQPYLIDVKDLAVVMQSQLAALNIKINIKLVDQTIILQQARAGNHVTALQVMASPGEPTYPIDQYGFGKGAVYAKASNYENPELQELIHSSYAQNDQETLKKTFDKILNILASESPYFWLGFVHASNLWRDNVKGFKVDQGITMRVRDVSKD